MKNKKLTPEDVDNMPSNYRAPGMSPEMNAWLDAHAENHKVLFAALTTIGLEWMRTSHLDDGTMIVYVKDSAAREGLLVLNPGESDERTWLSHVVWKGVVSNEQGRALEQSLVDRGSAGLRDFGGLWIEGQGAEVYGPVKDEGDNN